MSATKGSPAPAQPPTGDDSNAADILLLEGIHAAAAATMSEFGLEATRRDGGLDPAALAPQLGRTRILGIRSKTRVTPPVLAAAPELLAIGCFCIGTNQVDVAEAGRRGIAVFNSPFSNTRSVAELTIAEIICLHRRLTDKSMSLHRSRWDKSAAHAHEVRGRTLGIVGYGHIGSQVSVLAEALGMRVVYHDIAAKLPLGNAQSMNDLHEVLAGADVVTIHVPETPSTRGLIGPAEIARMRPGAFLINNARGTVVDLDAVADAVRRGHLGGAASDVYPAEPATAQGDFTCPLTGLPNVILTPHIGGSTEEAQANIAREVAIKIARFIQHGTTTSAVNVPEVELPHRQPDQHRILHFHRNVPGVLSKMHGLLAENDVNINAEYLQSNAEVSYVILDVDPHHVEDVRAGLEAIPETIRVRTLR